VNMPSKHQRGTNTAYESKAERYLLGSNQATTVALIRGMTDIERARSWYWEASRLDASDRTVMRLEEKITELEATNE